MDYKYNKRAGALNEAAAPMPSAPSLARRELATQNILDADDYASAHDTGVHGIPVAQASVHAQSIPERARVTALSTRAPGQAGSGVDPISLRGGGGVFFYTVQDGQRVRVIEESGEVRIVAGPTRIWRGGRRIEPMTHYVAHPGEFLIVRFRNGKQEHLIGPTELWFDPRIHAKVEKEDTLQIASKEAVVVYTEDPKSGEVSRRVVNGPASFVPEPGEWLHTFSWHGSKGGQASYQKVPNGLVFQKLWFLPDQMYHDVPDVRTADDAVLTVRLMLFFELVDVEIMLDTTHDPIGDFVNATTSDVVQFTSKQDFESFKRNTGKLNELESYGQLTARAAQCGYRINKVVYRGYGAPESLQRMQDEAIESRTKLSLDRATQEQAQDLTDRKLGRDHARAAKQRGEEAATLHHAIEQAQLRQQAELREAAAQREFARTEDQRDAELRGAIRRAQEDAERLHLAGLKGLGVDLTALLTQGRADRVIELRGGGGQAPHVHLDATEPGDGAPRR